MIVMGEVWRVMRGSELVGEITLDEADFPWAGGRFTPGPAYAALAPAFEEELALCAHLDEDVAAWEAHYDEIARLVSLESPLGPYPDYLLHIQGDRAWFR